ncbi:hypothetical protein [Halobacillus amylolyticus]|uniref:Sialyltransferase n=1 Tax=Halobacillus amylolyticus TaxID=2932259 RepID=A0ABY4H8W4_9BACI|nr:hypothetical protein [Halobacillus amylolyticus]UOR11316.1 hypothetical protein MUO15_17215 [Halobacillus amylolyticus]
MQNKTRTWTIKQICEYLWEFERENNLLDLEIQGVLIWQAIRFEVYSTITEKTAIYNRAHSTIDRSIRNLIKLPKLILNAVTRNPFIGDYTKEFLIYDHSRKITVDGKNIDIYTHYFIEGQNQSSFDVIETQYLLEHYTSDIKKNRRYRDHEMLTVLAKEKILPIRLTSNEKEKLKELHEKFCRHFNLSTIDIKSLAINKLNKFKYKYNYNVKLLKKRNPKYIYIVVSYGNMPLIAAAKDLGIKVIEFQHGVITNYHFAYNFSDPEKKIKYFPDKILTFGDYWAKTDGFPKQTEIEVYGFPYLNKQLEKYKETPKKKSQVLIISQGTIGRELSRQIQQVAESMPEYHFIYKLHPGEYDRWKSEYYDLIAASDLGNFEVIDHNEKNLYSYFAESEYQVGVYSTAIFEGITLNCKTILFNMPGIEYMKDLIDRDIVKVVRNWEEAIRSIKNYETKNFSRDYFFKEECKS